MTDTSNKTIVDQIDQCLPQTQCTLCSYPRCKEYARAIERNEAEINQCPPGGEITITALAKLLDKPVVELNPDYGEHESKVIALIREDECIGCKLCIRACPVDCIVGAGKLMHTVIADECTGCNYVSRSARQTASIWFGLIVRTMTMSMTHPVPGLVFLPAKLIWQDFKPVRN